ncbi:MAG TPA: hypothetical protein GXZ90_09945 [Clostridiales bacterium]|nr:hypothetical protein [Clostridiales bacterium]
MLYGENNDMQEVTIKVLPEFGEAYEVTLLTEDTDSLDKMRENINIWIENNLINVQAKVRIL